MTTWWGNVDFTDPKLFALWDPPAGGGVYLILARQPDAEPHDQYRPVYVGETDHFAARVTEAHSWFECWAEKAAGTGHLYVAVHSMGDESLRGILEREHVKEILVARLNPPCNGCLR
jgi:hypothetical protein